MSKVVYCPANDWDCPYCGSNSRCTLYPEFDPIEECDHFAYYWDREDDYIVDEEGGV